MGTKGDKLTQDSVTRANYLVDTLESLGDIRSKKMFGGHGIFYNDKMFAMVDSKGQCFLKVDDHLKSEFASLGSVPHSKMPYTSVPDDILENKSALSGWAKKSISLLT